MRKRRIIPLLEARWSSPLPGPLHFLPRLYAATSASAQALSTPHVRAPVRRRNRAAALPVARFQPLLQLFRDRDGFHETQPRCDLVFLFRALRYRAKMARKSITIAKKLQREPEKLHMAYRSTDRRCTHRVPRRTPFEKFFPWHTQQARPIAREVFSRRRGFP